MPRDYKSSRSSTAKRRPRSNRARKSTPRRKRRQTPGWVWMLGGLGIGLAVAAGVYIYEQASAPGKTADARQQPGARPAEKPVTARPDKKNTAEAGNETSRFDFYTLLPKMEVQIPESAIEEANRNLPHAEADLAYVLQTGSFRNHADAETMKANLALLGIEADIEAVVINDRETWHRVRLGPFPSMAAMNPVRRELKRHDIDFILLKVRL